jgi:hypothetical protein
MQFQKSKTLLRRCPDNLANIFDAPHAPMIAHEGLLPRANKNGSMTLYLDRREINQEGSCMNKDKWMIFIDHLWSVIAYWQLANLYRNEKLTGSFFQLTAIAIRNELLMRIAHTVHICEDIAKNYDVGEEATATLEEAKALFDKGNTDDRSALAFDDCGVKVYRDKIIGHPLNVIKAVLGKEEYKINLKWETVAETLEKLKLFASQVEDHYSESWEFSTYKEEVNGIDADFNEVIHSLKEAADYDKLKLEVTKRGRPRIMWDWQTGKFVFEE